MPHPWTLCDESERCLGYDIAHWQGTDIAWDACISLGIEWVVAKTWHATNRVKTAEPQLVVPKLRKLINGRYVWWLPKVASKAQVDCWVSTDASDELPMMIDVEEPDTDVRGIALLRRLEDLVKAVCDRTQRRPLIYTGTWYWNAWLGGLDSQLLAECELVIAAYPRKSAIGIQYHAAVDQICGQTPPALPLPWASRQVDPLAWQFDGDKGLYLPNKSGEAGQGDVDVDLAVRSRLRALVPSLRDTDPHELEPGLVLGEGDTARVTLDQATNAFVPPGDKGPRS